MTRLIMSLAILAASAAPVVASDGGPTPEQVAQRCHHRMRSMVRYFGNGTQHRTMRCVRIITRWKENGRDDAAAQAAEHCTDAVATAAEATIQRVTSFARQCAQVLTEMGAAEELVASLRNHAERATATIEAIRDRSQSRIQEALGGA